MATVDRTSASGDLYTFAYTVSEADPGNCVTANTKVQGVTVKVTDNRTGQLSAEVSYDNGSMSFSNTYGADSNFPLTIVGKKVVNGAQPGLSVPTLEGGEYTFEITAPDGTPMPQSPTAKNDSDGMVYFPVNYTMENVFGTDATADATAEDGVATLTAGRYKDFTYTITEDGSIEGVSNEGGSKTVVVRVTDQGGGQDHCCGHLRADRAGHRLHLHQHLQRDARVLQPHGQRWLHNHQGAHAQHRPYPGCGRVHVPADRQDDRHGLRGQERRGRLREHARRVLLGARLLWLPAGRGRR